MISILGEHEPYEFPDGFDNGIRLKDLLEDEVDEKFYISGEKVEKLISQLDSIKTDVFGIDLTINEPKERDIANCIKARYDAGVSNFKQDGTGVAIPCLTSERIKKRQNGRRFKEDGELMFTLTGQDRHGVLVIDDTQGFDGVRTYENESPCLRSQRSGLKVAQATKQVGQLYGTDKEPNPSGGRVGRQIANTLTCGCNQAVAIVQTPRGNNKGGIKEVCPTISAHSWEDNNHLVQNLRIRKLTPLECWRLMGFQDEHFQRATDAGISNSQLYKQAGNSIVVDVLEHIFTNLFKGDRNGE